MKKWQPDDAQPLQETLLGAVDNLVPGRSEEDLLYEIILKLGFDLSWPVESYDVAGTPVLWTNEIVNICKF